MAPERILAWMLGVIGASFVVLVGVGAILISGVFYDDGCPLSGHAPWSCLAWSNVDRFEAQVRAELPHGISSAAVRDYLVREKIKFREVGPTQSGPELILFGKYLPGSFLRPGYALDGGMTVRVAFDEEGKAKSLDIELNRKTPRWKD